jgi:hypothetical protein
MRKKTASSLAVLAFMLALAFPAAAPAAPAERHPRIEAAMRELREAREELNRAPHDFGGHRADAVHAIDEAIKQLEICMKY